MAPRFSIISIVLGAMVLFVAACGSGEATPVPTSADTVTPPAVGGGDPEKGKVVFISRGSCGACHKVSGVSGAVGSIGPNLNGIATRAATRKPPLTAREYLIESEEDPGAFIVSGFSNIMPAVWLGLSEEEQQDLLAFLLTLQ